MKNRGTVFPVAETARAEATNFPGLADTNLPICLQPWRSLTLTGVLTVAIPFRPCSISRPAQTADGQALL